MFEDPRQMYLYLNLEGFGLLKIVIYVNFKSLQE